MVWIVQRSEANKIGTENSLQTKWNKKLIFQDDGRTIRSTATAVLIAIDRQENGEKKQAWLFVAGPVATAIVASRINVWIVMLLLEIHSCDEKLYLEYIRHSIPMKIWRSFHLSSLISSLRMQYVCLTISTELDIL